jgi:hypothetical protein
MSRLTNVRDIKEAVSEVIELLDSMIEENGQDGDFDYCTYLEGIQSGFKKAKDELEGLMNTDVPNVFLTRELNKHVPSLNIEHLKEYLNHIQRVKEDQITKLQFEMSKKARLVSALTMEVL